MRAAALSLALAAAPAFAAPPGAAAGTERAVPAPVTAQTAVQPAPIAPASGAPAPVQPMLVQPAPLAPASGAPAPVQPMLVEPTPIAPASGAPMLVEPTPAAPTPPSGTVGGTAAAPGPAPSGIASPAAAQPAALAQGGGTRAAPQRPAAPLQAVIEKLGQGDRAFIAGDYRTALFAYQDAVYMAPQNSTARVKLGRAYLALRYPAQAVAQAEQALADEPDNEDARRLIQDARNPPPRQAATAPAAAPSNPSALRPAAAEEAPAVHSRVYRFALEPEEAAAAREDGDAARAAPAADDRAAAPAPAEPAASAAQADAGATRRGDADPGAAAAAPTPGQRYRAALEMLSKREFAEAIRELSEAIAANPRLAVAYAARGNAQFGLGRFREASEDYRAALAIDANHATPLYGLAECFRLLGDSAASAHMYQRYADSRASDVRDDLRAIAAKRAQELR